ncbi:hypothetical protein M4L39_13520 [Staphylococcus equorum]|uniref:hypothetical protein n=1 Tax=Staphylococcus equorum TaxID=246432 RepID=UPI002407F7E8|nr:hypothetical protein [Staphylococcus equorum]MDG0844432.1 hypothetical protein [Staphylococcus equorum]
MNKQIIRMEDFNDLEFNNFLSEDTKTLIREIGKSKEVLYTIYDSLHEVFALFGTKTDVINDYNLKAQISNEYVSESFGFCFLENVKDIDIAIKLLNSQKVGCREVLSMPSVYIIKYYNEECIELIKA